MKENQFKVLPLNCKAEVIVEITTSIYRPIIDFGHFVLMKDTTSCNLVSLWASIGTPVILIWERDESGVYRVNLDINVNHDGIIRISKKTKEGERRTDVNIVY